MKPRRQRGDAQPVSPTAALQTTNSNENNIMPSGQATSELFDVRQSTPPPSDRLTRFGHQPSEENTTAAVSLMPCASVLTHKRRENKYAAPRITPEPVLSSMPAGPL